MDLIIRELQPEDWDDVRVIYQQGIDTKQATFETVVPTWQEWDSGKLLGCRLIAQLDNQAAGWAALSPTSRRPVYAGIAEVSVYVRQEVRRKGVGQRLLTALIDCAEKAGIWTLQSSVFPENEATIALHKKMGFRVVGTRERIARHHGIWRDTILLERRSRTAGA